MTRGSFAGFLPLVSPKTTPPGGTLRGFCPWSSLSHAQKLCFMGFLRLVDYSGDMWPLILEDMGPGFWNIWDQDSGRYGTGFYSIWRQDSGAMGPLIGFSLTFNYLPRQYVHHN
jgi:hypothetical protein